MTEDEDTGTKTVQCLCKNLDPVTVVEDLKGIFADSKVEEVFSSQGITALANMEYYKMYIFYILCFKTLLYLYLLRVARRID